VPTAHEVGGINIPAAIGLAVIMLVFAASLVIGGHSPPPDADPPDDGGPGGGPPPPDTPDPPGPWPGGIPLDDAQPAAIRLRGERPRTRRTPARRPRDPARRHPTRAP
jgi:hypothetical protein